MKCQHNLVEYRSLPVEDHICLDDGDVRRLPGTARTLRVLSGCAWITHKGKDIIVNSGEEVILSHKKGIAVISSVSKHPLVYKVG